MSFRLFDAYAGLSEDQLKERCRQLCRSLTRWQLMAMAMSVTPGALDKLRPEDRDDLQKKLEYES